MSLRGIKINLRFFRRAEAASKRGDWMKINIFRLIVILLAFMAVLSCSTTRVLCEGEYRLAKNKVDVTNDRKFSESEITSYLKQQPNSAFIFGWSPSLSIYNWQTGKGRGWDRFVQKIGTAPVIYDSTLVESSIDNVTKHLEYLGYYDSRVTSGVKLKTGRKKAKVTYSVELGKQYPISSIEYVLPDGVFADEFMADSVNFTVHEGDYLSESALEAESTRSSKAMRDKGFYGFNKNYFFYEADTLMHNDSASLVLTINEYTRNETEKEAVPLRKFYMNDVTITYPKNLKFRESIAKDLNTVHPGDLYSETDISNTYSRLSSLTMFSGININTEKADTNLVDCKINLSQSKLQGFKVNLEASSNATGLFGISPQLSYYHKNIFKGGEWLTVSFMGNFQFKFNDSAHSNEFGVSAGLSFPRLLGLPYRLFKGPNIPRTDLSLSYNYQNRPEYKRNIISTSYSYNGNVKGRFYYQVYPVQLSIVRLFNMDPSFYASLQNNPFMMNAYQDHFDLGIGATLYYTTNSDVNPQTSYFYTRFQFDLSGSVISLFKPMMKKDESGAGMIWDTPYSQYIRGEWTVGKTWKFGGNNGQAVATRFVAGAGYAYGNSSELPFEKHFYVGGSNSLRGWMARTVGPGLMLENETFVIPNQTGDFKLEANAEYRFWMFWKLAGAVFIDAGNVWTFREMGDSDRTSKLTADTFLESIAADWGVGIRLDLNFLVLRVDLGLRVHDPARDNKWVGPDKWFKDDGYAVHFGVGYPF